MPATVASQERSSTSSEPLLGISGAAPSAVETPTTGPTVEPATLEIANRPIFTFRAMMLGRSPRGRVEGARARIFALLERDITAPVTTTAIPEGTLISIGGEGVFVVTPSDLEVADQQPIAEAASETADRLSKALKETVELQSGRRLLWAIGLTSLATILFVLAVIVITRVQRRLSAFLEGIAARKVDAVRSRGIVALDRQHVVRWVHFFVTLVAWIAGLAAAQVWISFSLRQFPYTRPWGEDLRHYLLDLLERIGVSVAHAIPGLIIVAIIVIVARLVVRLTNEFFRRVEKEEIRVSWLYPDTAAPTRRIAVVVVWLFALAFAYPFLPGSDSAAFKGISVFVGLIISLGSTNLVNQSASGLVLMYSRALLIGDYVSVGDTEGTVMSRGLLSTKIRTIKQEEVNIPNSVLMSGTTKNYTRLAGADGVILYSSVTIGYSAPMRQVEAMLLRAAARTPGLRKEPPPFVLQKALADFYVEYQINARLERPEMRQPVLSALHANIQDEFNEHGVQIMSPHYMMDPSRPVVVAKEHWYAPPAAAPQEGSHRQEPSSEAAPPPGPPRNEPTV